MIKAVLIVAYFVARKFYPDAFKWLMGVTITTLFLMAFFMMAQIEGFSIVLGSYVFLFSLLLFSEALIVNTKFFDRF